MELQNTLISDIKIVNRTLILDERGFFTEVYKQSEYIASGIPAFVQDNMSMSSKGVLRGLHWQVAPHGQGKLVTCISGSIFDVAVDIRKDSLTFGHHVGVVLDSKELNSLWIPEGFAHGFQSLEDRTVVLYKVTQYWERSAEKSLNYSCYDLGIEWPIANPIVSNKDREAGLLKDLYAK